MSSVADLSNQELDSLAAELVRREGERRNSLRRLILTEAGNKGFNLGNVWRNEGLHGYTFREILAACNELEQKGVLELRDEVYVARED